MRGGGIESTSTARSTCSLIVVRTLWDFSTRVVLSLVSVPRSMSFHMSFSARRHSTTNIKGSVLDRSTSFERRATQRSTPRF